MSQVPQPTVCSKCNGTMERGYVRDAGHGAAFLSSWTPGAPRKSFLGRWWSGLLHSDDVAIKDSAHVVPLAAFRCRDCGYTEFYAHTQFAAE